jgi:hypothetical protein
MRFISLVTLALIAATAQSAAAQAPAEELAAMTGTWDVVMTFRPDPDQPPAVVKGIVAQRTLVGQYLQEVMQPAPGSASGAADFRRISYLAYNTTDSRWEYGSIDTRVTGVMTRSNFGGDLAAGVAFYIASFTLPLELGEKMGGRAVRLRDHMKRHSADRDELLQYWTPPGGGEWLAVHYEYRRR